MAEFSGLRRHRADAGRIRRAGAGKVCFLWNRTAKTVYAASRRIGKPLDRVSHDAAAHRAAASPFLIFRKAEGFASCGTLRGSIASSASFAAGETLRPLCDVCRFAANSPRTVTSAPPRPFKKGRRKRFVPCSWQNGFFGKLRGRLRPRFYRFLKMAARVRRTRTRKRFKQSPSPWVKGE